MTASPSRVRHPVRPRWVWGGTLTSIVGLAVLSLGVVLLSWPWSLAGIALALVGAVVAWRGGVLYDVHSSAPTDELRDVLDGALRDGVAAGETVTMSSTARRRTAAVESRRRRLEGAAMAAPRPGPTRPAGWLLLVVAAFLFVAQWTLYPLERPGQTNAVRALGAAIVLALAGSRLATAVARPPRIAASVSIVAGLALLANAVLADHDVMSTAAGEGVGGVLACVAGTAVLASAASRRGRPW